MNRLIDLFLAPFRGWPPEVALVVFGAATGLLVLVIFKLTSRPDRVARARDRALARVIELWLFRHDPVLGLGSIGRMLLDNLRYLATLILPMVCSLLPMLLLLAQGHDWFASRAPAPGEPMLVVARLRVGVPASLLDQVELAGAGSSLHPAAPPVRTPAWREIAWSVVAGPDDSLAATPATPPHSSAGGELVIRAGGAEVRKAAPSAAGLARRSVLRSAGRADRLLHPGEPRLPPDAPFDRIETRWPAAEYNLLGWRTNWFWGLLAASLLAGLLLKRPLRVEF